MKWHNGRHYRLKHGGRKQDSPISSELHSRRMSVITRTVCVFFRYTYSNNEMK